MEMVTGFVKDKPRLRNFEEVFELSYSVAGHFDPKNEQNVDLVSDFLSGFKTILKGFKIQEQDEKYDLKIRVETISDFNYQIVNAKEMLCSSQIKILCLLTSNDHNCALFRNNKMMPLILRKLRAIKHDNSQKITEQPISAYKGPSILRKKIDPEYLSVTIEGYRRFGESWDCRHPMEKLAQMLMGQR